MNDGPVEKFSTLLPRSHMTAWFSVFYSTWKILAAKFEDKHKF